MTSEKVRYNAEACIKGTNWVELLDFFLGQIRFTGKWMVGWFRGNFFNEQLCAQVTEPGVPVCPPDSFKLAEWSISSGSPTRQNKTLHPQR